VPNGNGKVEQSRRTGENEFSCCAHFRTVTGLPAKLRRCEHAYAHRRPHLALAGNTPAERVCELEITVRTVQAMA